MGGNASTIEGGGKKKTEFHFQLMKTLFENHAKYGDVFTQVLTGTTKEQATWGDKIKN